MYRRPNLSKTSQPPRKKKNVEPTSQNPRALRDERKLYPHLQEIDSAAHTRMETMYDLL